MSQKYYYTNGTERFGPYSIEELANKGINRTTKVWKEGLDNWVDAQDISELKTLFEYEPPIPPLSKAPNTNNKTAVIPPNTWLVQSILVTLFCCLPFGIAGIVNASKVESKFYAGDPIGAERASRNAKKWTIAGVVSALVIWAVYFLFFLIGAGVAALEY